MAKKWFSAKLLFICKIQGHPERDPLCEETIVLIRAVDEADARKAAKLVGKEKELCYKNKWGELVYWKWLGVLEIQDPFEKEMKSGAEVFYRLFRKSSVRDPDVRKLIQRSNVGKKGRASRPKR